MNRKTSEKYLRPDGLFGSYADFVLTVFLLTFTVSAVTPWIVQTFPEVMELVQVKGAAIYNLYIHFVFTCGISVSCAHFLSHFALAK